jgi:serine-type D-Ala-D-Ala carboxypeptidase/endopeptidase (penicillin-binding protein 4)
MNLSLRVVANTTLSTSAVIFALALGAGLAARADRASANSRRAPRASETAQPVANANALLSGELSHQLALAGSQSGAYVYDLTRKAPLFALRPDVQRAPASVEKLYTSTTALELMGPSATLQTTVLGSGHLGPRGRWEGNIYLHGGGDPTFGSPSFIAARYGGLGSSVTELASLVKAVGIRSVSGRVDGDESYFDSLRGEPSSGYLIDPYLEGELSALAFNRGESGGESGPHALAAYAARQFRSALGAEGISTHGGTAASAPRDAHLLATLPSPALRRLLGLMLPPSDNFFAETLIKDLGARFGDGGSTASGASVVRREIARFGIHARVVDGSGLSHTDATSPREVVSLLADLAPTPLGTTLRNDLAVAGHTGTLSERMRNTPAAGRCEGKTGTLEGVSNLAGYCRAANGEILAFAFFTDGIETVRAHTIQDAMTISLARY